MFNQRVAVIVVVIAAVLAAAFAVLWASTDRETPVRPDAASPKAALDRNKGDSIKPLTAHAEAAVEEDRSRRREIKRSEVRRPAASEAERVLARQVSRNVAGDLGDSIALSTQEWAALQSIWDVASEAPAEALISVAKCSANIMDRAIEYDVPELIESTTKPSRESKFSDGRVIIRSTSIDGEKIYYALDVRPGDYPELELAKRTLAEERAKLSNALTSFLLSVKKKKGDER